MRMNLSIPRPLAAMTLGLLATVTHLGQAADYDREIRPLLESQCLECHGPDKQRSGIRVDERALLLRGGDTGEPALVPGKPEASSILKRLRSQDPEMAMPYKRDPLTEAQIQLLEDWIREGAPWPGQMEATAELSTDHWSFLPVSKPAVPGPQANPVDAFLESRLAQEGIAPNGPTKARSWLRRASIVLTGFPPTHERIQSFEASWKQDTVRARSSAIEELLASPHFGERWAQHWLDVIRWAESNGSESNLYRKNAWLYRDYVVRSFNRDLPYNRFIQEQIAGDLLGAGEATGFLVAGPHVPAATVGREPSAIRQARSDRMDEILQTVGASVLGVTIGCARCHNHKFDPVSMKDYYSMAAVFEGVEFGGRVPEWRPEHPRSRRAAQLWKEIQALRDRLAEGLGSWNENWGGFSETAFAPTRTRVLRIEYDRAQVFIDEVEAFGTEAPGVNLALASRGTRLVEDPEMADAGSPVTRANDGEYGTMVWKSRASNPAREKPWIELHFPAEVEVDRFRFSANREYYFETDYLTQGPNGTFPGVRILVPDASGSWKELAHSSKFQAALQRKTDLREASEKLHERIRSLQKEGPQHAFIGRFMEPGPTHILHRGSPENPRQEVVAAGFEVLDGKLQATADTPDPERRRRFAEWLTDPDHPLTARVMVNRVWHHVFGTGIVPTTSDFGRAGAPPTHPELLDWLAAEWVKPSKPGQSAWSIKDLLRQLTLSDAFLRSSTPSPLALERDAQSSLLWRFPPRRVEAEVIRDGILLASGKLDPTLGGPSYRIHNEKRTYAQWEVVDNHGPQTWRRMLYQERMRRVDDHLFSAFDFPDCGQVRAKRPVSTTPLQALNLLNSDFVVEQSRFIAERALKEAPAKEGALERVFQLLLGRNPTPAESYSCQDIPLELVCRSLINSNEYAFLP